MFWAGFVLGGALKSFLLFAITGLVMVYVQGCYDMYYFDDFL